MLLDCSQCQEVPKWSWTKFIIGKSNNKFLAWCMYMIIQSVALFTDKVSSEHTPVLIIVSAAVTFIFMLAGAVDKAVANAKVEASLKAGISK